MPKDVAFILLGAAAIVLLVTMLAMFGRSRSGRSPKDLDDSE